MEVTVWLRFSERRGGWELNHLEDGWDPSRTRPTPKLPIHERSWRGGRWYPAQGTLVAGYLTYNRGLLHILEDE